MGWCIVYRLVGSDTTWSAPTAERTVHYPKLPPGDYTFEVMAITPDGVRSAQPARFPFSIVPAWWQRDIVRLGIALGIILTLVLLFRQRIRAVRREQQHQEKFSKRMIEAQESYRQKIASDLHDSIGQNLLIINNGLRQFVRRQTMLSPDELAPLGELTQQTINEVREISYELHPHILDRLGLAKAIESALNTAATATGIHFHHTLEPLDQLLTDTEKIHLFRIVQEAINNIVKHSGAMRASVLLQQRDRTVHLIISDEGKGFARKADEANESASAGIGLANIRERTRILGGECSIADAQPHGTCITITMPLKRGARA